MFRLHEQQVVFRIIRMNQPLIDQPMAVIANALNRTCGIICEKRILLYRDIFPGDDIKAGQLQRVCFQNMCDGFRDRWKCLITRDTLRNCAAVQNWCAARDSPRSVFARAAVPHR